MLLTKFINELRGGLNIQIFGAIKFGGFPRFLQKLTLRRPPENGGCRLLAAARSLVSAARSCSEESYDDGSVSRCWVGIRKIGTGASERSILVIARR